MTDAAIARRLEAARARIAKATRALEQAQEARDEAIIEASEAGWSLRRIAAAVGVNFARVRQLKDKRNAEPD